MHSVLGYGLAWMLLTSCASHTPRVVTSEREAVVRSTLTAWINAFQQHDLDGIAAGFAEDAVALYPRSAPTIGRQANRAAWAAFFAMPNAEHPLTIDTVVVAAASDMAFTRGRYAVHYDSSGQRVDLGGEYLAVWRPDAAGLWRIATLAANMYTPRPSVARRP